MPQHAGMTLRPYQLLCAVCSLGGEHDGIADKRSEEILAAVRNSPDIPITLRCNTGDVFVYQDAGTGEDTPEGAEFNVRRDLEILHKLNLFPGCTLPARILFYRLLAQIEEVSGICGYGTATSNAWEGCPKAGSRNYERGRALGIDAVIPPRSEGEMRQEKAESLKAMYSAEAIRVRPHILLCSVCQYGGGARPPYPEDNLPELIQLILKKPETPITLVPYADWAMCAPCPYRAAQLNACVNNRGSGGLPNQMRDLRVLQKLGLSYRSTLPARELYRLIFTRISGTLEICRLEQVHPSVWYTGCGEAERDSADYERGKAALSGELGIVNGE